MGHSEKTDPTGIFPSIQQSEVYFGKDNNQRKNHSGSFRYKKINFKFSLNFVKKPNYIFSRLFLNWNTENKFIELQYLANHWTTTGHSKVLFHSCLEIRIENIRISLSIYTIGKDEQFFCWAKKKVVELRRDAIVLFLFFLFCFQQCNLISF